MFIISATLAQNSPPAFETKKYAMIAQGKKCETINDYLRNCVGYPYECLKNKDEGTEVVKFEVTPNGELENFEVVNSVSPVIDKHVIQMLRQTSGMWSPALKNGNPVTMEKEISILFKYGEFEEFALQKDFKEKAKACLYRGNKLLLVKNKPEKAMKLFNRAIKYCPNEDCLRVARGLCRYELGDIAGAYKDWQRMNIAGISTETKELTEQMSDLKGFEELAQILERR
jgi:TonB family protein